MSTVNINFNEICKTYVNLFQNSQGHNKSAVTERDLRPIKLGCKKEDIVWTDTSNIAAGNAKSGNTQSAVKVNVESATCDVFGHLQTVHNVDNKKRVVITNGLCSGLDTIMSLPLHGTSKEVLDEIGDSVEIDPREPENFVDNKVQVTLTSGLDAIEAGTSKGASVITETKKYEGNFVVKVYPRGAMRMEQERTDYPGRTGHTTIEIQDIIRELRISNWEYLVKDFKQDGDGFFWEMQGYCDFKWESVHKHQWR